MSASQLIEGPGEVAMRRQELSQFDERAHDGNVHLNGPWPTQDGVRTPMTRGFSG